MSFLMKLDSSKFEGQSSSDFKVNYTPPIDLDTDYEISLIQANIWYSWHNISDKFNNNTFEYWNGTIWKRVTIPNGIYSINSLNNYIHYVMKNNNDYNADTDEYYINFIPNYSTFKLLVDIQNNYQLNLSISDLNEILGFDKIQYIQSSQEGRNQVDITRGVNSLQIHCSLVTSSYDNDKHKSDIIQSFSPTKQAGSLLVIENSSHIYIPLDTRKISQIRVYITDQKGRIMDLNGEHTTYLFHFKKV